MMDSPDTIFSLADEVPPSCDLRDCEDRSHMQPGAVGRGSAREICFLRKITPRGAVLCMDLPAKAGERLDLELLSGEKLSGTIDWVEGDEVGIRFDDPADIFALIARNLVRQPGDERRMPRIELSAPAWLEAGSRHEIATVRNLSHGGARIETKVPLVVHEHIVLTLDGFRPAPATVRWVQGNAAGIAFTPDLPWQELMPWLRRRFHKSQAPEASSQATAKPQARMAQTRPPEAKQGISLSLAARVRDGSRRWSIEVESIDSRQISFVSYAAVELGRLFWITLPGLEGWPARVTDVNGYQVTCVFTQPLHPAVLERVLASRG